jgi:protein-tyrosine phosphatase
MSEKTSVLFVCLGNICRSPTAEGVFRHLLKQEGLVQAIRVDSAGTGAWHVGESPDRRSAAAARRRGVVLAGAARKVIRADFTSFHYVLAMDRSNYDNLLSLAPDGAAEGRVRLFRDFDPDSPPGSEVPDPYYGGDRGFEDVFDICDAASRGLLAHLRAEHGF